MAMFNKFPFSGKYDPWLLLPFVISPYFHQKTLASEFLRGLRSSPAAFAGSPAPSDAAGLRLPLARLRASGGLAQGTTLRLGRDEPLVI